MTAEVLRRHCASGGPTVLHDLRMPMAGTELNIDHVVVSGRTVTIIDSKLWKPGFIWTFKHVTRRGMKRLTIADKHTMVMATISLTSYLRTFDIDAEFRRSLVVIWPSRSHGHLSVAWYRPRGAYAITGQQLSRRIRHWVGAFPADPETVSALSRLVIDERG